MTNKEVVKQIYGVQCNNNCDECSLYPIYYDYDEISHCVPNEYEDAPELI